MSLTGWLTITVSAAIPPTKALRLRSKSARLTFAKGRPREALHGRAARPREPKGKTGSIVCA